jgi:hypothetical protein
MPQAKKARAAKAKAPSRVEWATSCRLSDVPVEDGEVLLVPLAPLTALVPAPLARRLLVVEVLVVEAPDL